MTQRPERKLPDPPRDERGWPWRTPLWSRGTRLERAPRISVVIPSFNQGEFLEATLRSVLLQNYPDMEVIVIDGGSTDDSVAILRKYEPWLTHWVSERDRGQAHAINKGLAVSTGEILGFLNSDDLYMPGALRRVAGAFGCESGLALVHGDRVLIDAQGDVLGWTALPPFDHRTMKCDICSETAFWTRAIQEAVGVFNENLGFALDVEYFGRLYQRGVCRKIDRFLGCFRCHAGAKSATIEEVGNKEYQETWERLFGKDCVVWDGPPVSRLGLIRAGLRSPGMVFGPYVVKKLKSALRRY